jgi:hypothetical protein
MYIIPHTYYHTHAHITYTYVYNTTHVFTHDTNTRKMHVCCVYRSFAHLPSVLPFSLPFLPSRPGPADYQNLIPPQTTEFKGFATTLSASFVCASPRFHPLPSRSYASFSFVRSCSFIRAVLVCSFHMHLVRPYLVRFFRSHSYFFVVICFFRTS